MLSFGWERFGPILDQIYVGPFLKPLKVLSWGIVVHNPQFMGFRSKMLNCLNADPQQVHGCTVRLMGYHDDSGGLDGKHNSPIYLNEIFAAVYRNLQIHSLPRGCRSD